MRWVAPRLSLGVTTSAMYACPQCGNYLVYGQLACNRCGALVYRDRLNQLASEAMRLEPTDRALAAMHWRQALDLLPPDAHQAAMIRQRVHALEGREPFDPAQAAQA